MNKLENNISNSNESNEDIENNDISTFDEPITNDENKLDLNEDEESNQKTDIELENEDTDKPRTFELVSAIEAILFASGDPIPSQNLLEFFQINETELDSIINLIQDEFNNEKHGIELRKIDGSYAFATKPNNKDILSTFFSKPIKSTNLSQAAYETLAVVAYNQPVTRADIEQVRGVNSDGALNRLIEKGLVEQTGSLETPGRPSLFSVTNLFFNLYGIEDLSQLEPMDMLMYDTIIDFEKSYQMEENQTNENSIDAGEELGTVY